MEYQRKPIKGYEGYYEVDTEGNIYNIRTGRKLSPLGKRIHPYLHVQLSKNGNVKNISIHRIVAETFVFNPTPETTKFVNHKDGNKYNNNADNLEWVTPTENNLHYFNVLKADKRRPREIFGYNKKTGELEVYFKDCRELEKDSRFSKSAKRIVEIANGKYECNGDGKCVRRKTCMGLLWLWTRISKDEAIALCKQKDVIRKTSKENPTIYAYNTKTGEIVGQFSTYKEVALTLNPNPTITTGGRVIVSRVGSVLKQEYDAKTYFGYFLSYKKLTPEQVKKKFETQGRKVFSYDPKSGELIEEFDSEKEVRQKILCGKSSTELYRILRNQNRRVTMKGRYWSYEKLSPEQVKKAVLEKKQKTKVVICKENGKIYQSVFEALQESGAKCSYSTFCYLIRDGGEINGLHYEYYEPQGPNGKNKPCTRLSFQSQKGVKDE